MLHRAGLGRAGQGRAGQGRHAAAVYAVRGNIEGS